MFYTYVITTTWEDRYVHSNFPKKPRVTIYEYLMLPLGEVFQKMMLLLINCVRKKHLSTLVMINYGSVKYKEEGWEIFNILYPIPTTCHIFLVKGMLLVNMARHTCYLVLDCLGLKPRVSCLAMVGTP
jgi:hypothetical protein